MPTSFLWTAQGHFFSITQTDGSSYSTTGKETEQRSRTLASTIDILDRYSIQIFTILKPPADDRPAPYHFPPKLSQKNACSAYSE